MSQTKDPNDMTAAELEAYIAKLEADLDDVEEERRFVLGQTGLHLEVKAVTKFESQMESLKGRIEESQRLLGAKSAG